MWKQSDFLKVLRYSSIAHSNQKVKDCDANYLYHLVCVFSEVVQAFEYKQNFDLDFAINLCFLHDILEDTPITDENLLLEFDSELVDCVNKLSKKKHLTKEQNLLLLIENIKNSRIELGIIKLADRISNLSFQPIDWSKEKKTEYIRDSQFLLSQIYEINTYLENELKIRINAYKL